MKETLGEYVRCITQQKGISLRELARMSGGRVTGSHLSKIVKGVSRNVTVETVVGLAAGLDVDLLVLADAVRKLATDPRLLELIREWARMSAKDQERMFDSLRFINERGKDEGDKKR